MNWSTQVKGHILVQSMARHSHYSIIWKTMNWSTLQKNHMSTQNVTHVLVHTRNKPHACSKCDKAFLNKSRLHTHELFHTGKKPHACSKCDKGDKSIKLKRISAPKYVLQNSGLPLSSGQFPGDQNTEGPTFTVRCCWDNYGSLHGSNNWLAGVH